MTDRKQTRGYLILIALANVVVLCLCAAIWLQVFSGRSAVAGVSIRGWYLGSCVLAVAIVNLAVGLFLQRLAPRTEQAMILVILLLAGLLVNVIYLPLNVPDETTHFSVTYNLSGKFYSAVGEDELETSQMQSGIWQDKSDLSAIQRIHAFWYDHSHGSEYSHNDSNLYIGAANYPTYGYLPAAVGVAIARALSMPYQALLILGRMCNYVFFLLLILLSCRVAPDLRMAILAIAGLPSTIWLVASYSYDGWNLGFSMLFAAYLWRLTTHKEQIGIRQIVLMVLLLLSFAPIKYIYVLLGLLVFAIPLNQWKNLKIIIGAIVIGGVGGVIVLRSRLAEVLTLLFTSSSDTRGLEQGLSGSSYTISYVVRHPMDVALTFIKTFYTDLEKMFERMLVGEFHSDAVPGYLAAVLGVLFLALFLSATRQTLVGRERTGHGVRTAWIYRIVLALGILAIYGSFLFLYSYYNEGEIGVISGVQGRYFLPLALLLAPCGSARLASRCSAWMERRRIQPVQLLAGMMYVSLLVLLCRMVGFVE